MSDETTTTPQTDPLAKSTSTLEGKLAIVGTVLGILGAVVPPVWEALSGVAATYPQVRWLVGLVSALGLVTTILVTLGYAKSRAAVKVAAIQAQAQVIKK